MDLVVIRAIRLIRRLLVVDPVLTAEEVEVINAMDGCAPTVANCVHM